MAIIFSWQLRLKESLVPTLLLLVVGYGISASAQVPPLPTGLSPSDGAQIAATTQVVLSWTAVPGASSYNVRANNWSNSVIRDPQNNCPNSPHYLCVDGVVTTSIAMPVDPGSTYGFFLNACNALGCGDVAAANFTVLTAAPPTQSVPPVPTGLSPANTTLAAGTTSVTLTWSPVAGATSYAVRANDSTDPNPRAPANNCGPAPHYLCVNGVPSNVLAVPVTAGHSYNWWVHACNALGCGDPASNVFSVDFAPPPPPPSGNATISAMAGPWPISIRTCDHDAGAICSLTWRNKEFIDDYDHGRQLQSASSFDGMGESFNPTEAGAEVPYNGINPSASSSRLRAISASNNLLTTETDMAFWRPVGGRAQSGHILNKQVKIGAFGLAHVIEYLTTFTIPAGEAHSSATFEVLTGYMPPEFDQFWTLDVKAGATNLVPLVNANSEQGLPIIFSTSDGGWAMGIYSPDSPQPNYPGIGYGRWKYPSSGNIVKWNNVFRFSNPPRINNFRSFVIVGSLDNVRVSMQQLHSIVY